VPRSRFGELVSLAEENDGLVTADHARQAGFTDSVLARLVQRGRIERTSRGVYRVPTLDAIDEALIEKYVQERRKQVSPATVNRQLATLRRALRLAHEWKVIDRLPKIRLLQGERTREFVLSREQEPVYLNAAPQPLKDLALLMLNTGLRDGEALALRWPDFHMQPAPSAKFGYLQVQKGKSVRARRTVSLTARVQTMLAARPEKSSSEFVFPGRSGKPMLVTSLDHLHAKVRKSLKMPADFVVHSLTSHHADPTRYAGCGCFHNYENRRP